MVTLIPGDGIGPEISSAVKRVYTAAQVPIEWEETDVTPIIRDNQTAIPDDAYNSINKNKVALKGPLETPVGKGHRSLNLTLRQCVLGRESQRMCRASPVTGAQDVRALRQR